MKAGDVEVSLLCDLQFLSKNRPLLDIYNFDANSIFWRYDLARSFRCCLKKVANLIKDEGTAHFVKYDAIDFASSLIHYQKALFLRFKNLIINKNSSHLYSFISAFSKEHVNILCIKKTSLIFHAQTFLKAKKALDDLLAIYFMMYLRYF